MEPEPTPPAMPIVPYRRDLFLAIRHGRAEEVERLLAMGADPNWTDRRGQESALGYAALGSTVDVVRVLLSYGATDWGTMPLEQSAVGGGEPAEIAAYPKMLLLLEHGGDTINLAGAMGLAPLCEAAYAGDLATVQLLLDHGAGVHGPAALAVALTENHFAVAELLRKAGPTG